MMLQLCYLTVYHFVTILLSSCYRVITAILVLQSSRCVLSLLLTMLSVVKITTIQPIGSGQLDNDSLMCTVPCVSVHSDSLDR